MRLRIAALSLAVAAVVAWPGSVWAHPVIIRSDPAPGSRVRGPVLEFHLQYNNRVDAERSSLVLDLPHGRTRLLPVRPQASPDTLGAKAEGVAPGAYRLH